ncbi:MAG: hypothetical protein Ct9H90mP4_08870 [Gammaproteobacteria bacterium]|nr:MAG: hypothetical protein Ct9H90mP4_08870 [Gammaproteobacteria bacterium]
MLADEGEKNGTLQLISGSGSIPGGSPDQAPTDKFNVETPGFPCSRYRKYKIRNTCEVQIHFCRNR